MIKSAATLRLADLQDVRAVVFMLHPRIAAPVRDFGIELDSEMFAINGKLSDGAGAKWFLMNPPSFPNRRADVYLIPERCRKTMPQISREVLALDKWLLLGAEENPEKVLSTE